jgi:hypothetical protein
MCWSLSGPHVDTRVVLIDVQYVSKHMDVLCMVCQTSGCYWLYESFSVQNVLSTCAHYQPLHACSPFDVGMYMAVTKTVIYMSVITLYKWKEYYGSDNTTLKS